MYIFQYTGYDDMALRVTLAVPAGYASSIDTQQVKNVFPYGKCHLEIVEGGGAFSSGKHMYTHTYTQAYVHIHTYMCVRAHVHAHAYTHLHEHTHALARNL